MTRTLVWLAVIIALAVAWFAYSRLPAPPPGGGDKGRTDAERERAFPEGLPAEALPRLMRWLQEDGSPAASLPSRDIFQRGFSSAVAPKTPAPVPPLASEMEPVELDRPRLTGFVFGGGRIGGPVAAIRFEGRMWLVGVGERVGPFRVEAMVVGEEATLVDQESGETLRLTIE